MSLIRQRPAKGRFPASTQRLLSTQSSRPIVSYRAGAPDPRSAARRSSADAIIA